jgi:hypothetical protein
VWVRYGGDVVAPIGLADAAVDKWASQVAAIRRPGQ